MIVSVWVLSSLYLSVFQCVYESASTCLFVRAVVLACLCASLFV